MNRLLVISFAAAFALDLAVPILVALWMRRRWSLPFRLWSVGAGVFAVSQGVLRIPIVTVVQGLPAVQEAIGRSLGAYVVFAAALSLSAGLFEEGGRWIGLRYFIRERGGAHALFYGAGHGGIESIAIGLLVLGSLIGYVTLEALPGQAAAPLSAEQAAQLEAARAQFAALAGWEPLLGAWERLAAQVLHLLFSLLVLQAFLRSPLWWWAAVAAHTGVNLSTLLLQHLAAGRWGAGRAGALTEGLLTLYALAAVWGIRRLLRVERESARPSA